MVLCVCVCVLIYTHTVGYYKKGNFHTCYNMDHSFKSIVLTEIGWSQKTVYDFMYLHEVPKVVKSMKTDSRMVFARTG